MKRFPDRQYFERVARETGFRPGPLETVFRLADLLRDLMAELGSEICLRGGTALNLLHLDAPRLSVDIDLDYVGSAETAQTLRRRPELAEHIAALGRTSGYEIVEERASYAMAHIRLHYVNSRAQPAFLKVDLNFLDRVPVLPPERRTLRHPFAEDLPSVTVQTAALEELAAGKAIALVRRGLARDLFDVAMLSSLEGFDLPVGRTVLVVRGAAYPPPSPDQYTTDAVDRVRLTSWRSEVVSLARRPLPLTFGNAKTRSREFLNGLLEFSDGHRAFLQALDRGRIRPDLLSLSGVQDRIARNPGLNWRLRVGARGLEDR